MELTYSVPGSFENTVAATKRLLAANGWKEYASPSEEPSPLNKSFKKGQQGISLFFMMPPGLPVHSAIQFTADRLINPLPFPNDATDIVFDDHRPYLSCVTGAHGRRSACVLRQGTDRVGLDAAVCRGRRRALAEREFGRCGGNGIRAYYINDDQRPIVLSLQRGTDEKTRVEIRNPPFAEPQNLEAGADVSGLPVPKRAISSAGRSNDTKTEIVAQIPAEASTVAAFYRREFANRNFKEEAPGAAISPDGALLTFSSPDGTAVVKLGHKYDLTTANLVMTVSPAVLAARAKAKKDADDKFMSDAQDMVNAALASDAKRAAANAQAANGPVETLRPLADSTAPVPVPETAEDVDYDADSGRLEFNSSIEFQGGRGILSFGDEAARLEVAAFGDQLAHHGRTRLHQKRQGRFLHHHADGQDGERDGGRFGHGKRRKKAGDKKCRCGIRQRRRSGILTRGGPESRSRRQRRSAGAERTYLERRFANAVPQ